MQADVEHARGMFAAFDEQNQLVAYAGTIAELERLLLQRPVAGRVLVQRVPRRDEPLAIGLG